MTKSSHERTSVPTSYEDTCNTKRIKAQEINQSNPHLIFSKRFYFTQPIGENALFTPESPIKMD